MQVLNNFSQTISVAINHWGSDGDTSFFAITPGKAESWDRSDDRGFVMSVKVNGSQLPYFVQANDKIVVEEGGSPIPPYRVLANGRVLTPLS